MAYEPVIGRAMRARAVFGLVTGGDAMLVEEEIEVSHAVHDRATYADEGWPTAVHAPGAEVGSRDREVARCVSFSQCVCWNRLGGIGVARHEYEHHTVDWTSPVVMSNYLLRRTRLTRRVSAASCR